MRFPALGLVALAGVLVAGCIPVPSLYPAAEGRGVEVAGIEGEWWDPGDPSGALQFERDSTGAYALAMPRTDLPDMRIDVTFFRLGERLFADLHVDPESMPGGDARPLLLPMHLFARVQLEADTLKLGLLDDAWVESAAKRHRIKVRFEKPGGELVLTEPTPGLRRMLEKLGGEDAAFITTAYARGR